MNRGIALAATWGPSDHSQTKRLRAGIHLALQHKNQIWVCDMKQEEVSHDVLLGYHLATNAPTLLKNTLYTNTYNTIKWIENPRVGGSIPPLGTIYLSKSIT
jgi:hypothetical protein